MLFLILLINGHGQTMGTVLAQVARHQHKYLRSQVSDMQQPPQGADTSSSAIIYNLHVAVIIYECYYIRAAVMGIS